MEVLSRHWDELKNKANYLNSFVGTKFKDGKDTGVKSIVIYVSKKQPVAELAPEHIIPSEIEGIPTDVVELAPTTWKAGKTGISELSPEEQLKKLGAIVERNPKVMVSAPPKLTGLEADWLSYCSKIQSQANCGACVEFGCIGIWEAAYRIAENNPADSLKLAEGYAFFCTGATCETGSDCPTILDYYQNTGVVPKSFYPYHDSDQACHQYLKPGSEAYVKKIKSWQTTTDLNIIRQWIAQGPLVAVMAVHNSFFNYVSGIYQSQGASDPVAGYHCIGRIGMSDSKQASHGRNSWDVTWGEAGYFWVAYGDS
jgi:C1A family cysteine protease